MGHELNPTTGKPTFDNTPSTVSDLQGAADYSARIAEASVATVVDLETIQYPRDGELRLVEADGSIWARVSGGWQQVAGASPLQLDTTNSTAFMVTQYGIGKVAGAAASSVSEVVTFPLPFASVPVVRANYIGGRTPVGAFNSTGLVDVSPLTDGKGVVPSLTGFTAMIYRPDSNLTATYDYYFSWSATGVLA